jgi:hypothetical protein
LSIRSFGFPSSSRLHAQKGEGKTTACDMTMGVANIRWLKVCVENSGEKSATYPSDEYRTQRTNLVNRRPRRSEDIQIKTRHQRNPPVPEFSTVVSANQRARITSRAPLRDQRHDLHDESRKEWNGLVLSGFVRTWKIFQNSQSTSRSGYRDILRVHQGFNSNSSSIHIRLPGHTVSAACSIKPQRCLYTFQMDVEGHSMAGLIFHLRSESGGM